MIMKKSTGWEEIIVGEYQTELILPNILRILEIKAGETVLDLGCGAGFFSREFHRHGAKVIGVDISRTLIEEAMKTSPREIDYRVGSAAKLGFIKSASVDKAAIILAIQNIDDMQGVFNECARVLKPGGKLVLVLNHPAFRIPKHSSWGWDEEKKIQYRRLDQYMSETKVKIQMHPGSQPRDYTITFHRPLQVYFKALRKAGFCIRTLEEWISPKKSLPGPRAKAENLARKEFPLFMALEAIK